MARESNIAMWSQNKGLREGGPLSVIVARDDFHHTDQIDIEAAHRRLASHRVRYLDGLRGIAVISVIGWHYYGPTYAANLPYGSNYSWLPLFGTGWLGVYLFFMISGFVIFRTLETCSGMSEFMIRRWIRLAPALLLCSTVISISSVFLSAMPRGGYGVINVLAGLTFINPSFYHAMFKITIGEVDGAYWTLYTEFSFYVVFGCLYFKLGWKWAINGLIALWILAVGLQHVPLPLFRRAPEPLWWAGCDHFGWFASGALFYRAHERRSGRLFMLAMVLGIASSLTNRLVVGFDILILLAVVTLFASCQRFVSAQRFIGSRGFLFVGTISYPLYLLHNHFGIGLIAYLSDRMALSSAYVPIVVFGLLLMASYLVHSKYEARVSAWLKARLLRVQL